MRPRPLIAALLFVLSGSTFASSFTYRGDLLDEGTPADGRYDLQFTLYADREGRQPLTGHVDVTDVLVTDGAFSVALDLPDTGMETAWLQVAVRDADEHAYWPLGEAEPVALKGAVCPAAWELGGNAGTLASSNFLGTTDAQPLVLRTANVPALRISPDSTVVSGGALTASLVAGSRANVSFAAARGAVVAGGGAVAAADPQFPSLAGPNRVASAYTTVGGGSNNTAGDPTDADGTTAAFAVVAGGSGNLASRLGAAVSGGVGNLASGDGSAVIGGGTNTASGANATVLGGSANCAGGQLSLAAGTRAKVRPGTDSGNPGTGCSGVGASGDANGDEGSFVWADSQNANFLSTGPNQFLLRAAGGVGINTTALNTSADLVLGARAATNGGDADADLVWRTRSGLTGSIYVVDSTGGMVFSTQSNRFVLGAAALDATRYLNTGANGAHLTAGGTWTNGSSRAVKQAIEAIDPGAVLDGVLALGISRWQYKDSAEGFHIGPMAEDFFAAFGTGGSDRHIATVDADGVALAAIQGLNSKLERENAALREELGEVAALRSQLAAMQTELGALRRNLQQLQDASAR